MRHGRGRTRPIWGFRVNVFRANVLYQDTNGWDNPPGAFPAREAPCARTESGRLSVWRVQVTHPGEADLYTLGKGRPFVGIGHHHTLHCAF